MLEHAAVTDTYRWPAMHSILWNLARADPALAQLRRRRLPGSNGKVVFTDQAYPDDLDALGETLADFLMVGQISPGTELHHRRHHDH